MRNPAVPRRRGSVSVQLVVIMVPVIFGLMGFAVDLGRLYSIKSELKAAANAAALAAAARLIGTEASTADATAAALLTVETATGRGNKYNFGGVTVGQTDGTLQSEMPDPVFYQAVADATGTNASVGGGAGEVSGSMAKYVKVSIRGEAPLLFWGLLAVATERKTPVEVSAVAGMSAPLCTACAIEPLAVAAVDAGDTTDFGFVLNTKYTLGFQCTGAPTPSIISGTTQRIPYLLLNRYDENATLFPDESQQAYRIGAQGLLPSNNPLMACLQIASADGETVWVNAAPVACSQSRVPSPVGALMCGLYARFDQVVPDSCTSVPEVDIMSQAYLPDTDLADAEDYAAYLGTGRRVITVPIVEALSTGDPMVVLGFRQFLVGPDPAAAVGINPGDQNGRFVALYIGSVMPLKQGRFDGCLQTAGPGKVVLHQ
ncbi:MAG: hypothetical protein HY822_01085 [Acidobacteria bacterium]|nr:hypothetical protein [Acidobacteriota bacterium]